MGPLSQRLEVVDRFTRFDLDHALKTTATLLGKQNDVRVCGGWTCTDRRILLSAGIDTRLVFPPELGLQKADNAIVLQLFADRPHENRAHRAPPNR